MATGIPRQKRARKAATDVLRPLDAIRTGTMSVNAALLEVLRADFLKGSIPAGVKLKIPELCARYSVSPGAVREALSRLVSEGLVDYADQRGFWSTAVDLDGLRDLTRVRILVEKEALADAIRHGDAAWEQQLRQAFVELCRTPRSGQGTEAQDWTASHKKFHRALVATCTSPWLTRLHNLYYDQTERYRMISASAGAMAHGSSRDVEGEHGEIMEVAIQRDVEKAQFLIEGHLRTTVDRVEGAILAMERASKAG